MKTRLLAILLLILTASQLRVSAQEETYKLDFGGQIGVSGYLGDASSSIFSHPGFSGGLSFRYLTDVRWSLRSLVNVLSISGDTDGMDDVFPGFARYDFKATVIEGGRPIWPPASDCRYQPVPDRPTPDSTCRWPSDSNTRPGRA